MRWTTILTAMVFVGTAPSDLLALREFKKTFEQHYAELLENKTVKTTFRKAKCNLCHVKGEKKDANNPYGEALSQLIDGDAEDRLELAKENDRKKEELEKLLAELKIALAQVEALESPNGMTFGERILGGKLPVEIPAGEDGGEDGDDEDDEDSEGEEQEE